MDSLGLDIQCGDTALLSFRTNRFIIWNACFLALQDVAPSATQLSHEVDDFARHAVTRKVQNILVRSRNLCIVWREQDRPKMRTKDMVKGFHKSNVSDLTLQMNEVYPNQRVGFTEVCCVVRRYRGIVRVLNAHQKVGISPQLVTRLCVQHSELPGLFDAKMYQDLQQKFP